MAQQNWIFMPCLQNGVMTIGDLWDARSSQKVGFNLFGNSLTTEATKPSKYLTIEPSSESYKEELSHIKDTSDEANHLGLSAEISAELLGGFIKITGGIDFEIGSSNKMSEERIQKIITVPKYLVRIKETAEVMERLMDPHVVQLVKKQKLEATHVVTSLNLGGSLLGDIRISQLNKGNRYKLGLFLEGTIDLVIVSATIGASAEVSEDVKTSNYQKTIKLSSMPPIDIPTEIEEFIDIGSKFHEALKTQHHFPFWNIGNSSVTVRGIPVGFILVPLSQFLSTDFDPTPLPSIDPTDLETFRLFLGKLRDWTGVDYLKRLILAKRNQLQKILSEPTHSITVEIVQKEQELMEEAELTMQCTTRVYKKFKDTGEEPVWIELFEKLKKVCIKWDGPNGDIMKFVGEMEDKGNDELDAVNIEVKDEDIKSEEYEKNSLVFFTNELDIQNWLGTTKLFKILYKASTTRKTEGIPQKLYNLSFSFSKINIQPGIAYPTLTSTLALKKGKKYADNFFTMTSARQTLNYSDSEEVLSVLDILEICSSTNTTQTSMGVLHLYTSYLELLGCKLHVNVKEDIMPIVTGLKEFFNGIEICPSKNATTNTIERPSDVPLKVVLTTDGVRSTRHVVHAILNLQALKSLLGDSFNMEIIVGTFELDKQPDSPLAFLFSGGELIGICLDRLDLLIFMDNIVNGQSPSELLAPEKIHLHPLCSVERVQFGEQVRDLYKKKEFDEELDALRKINKLQEGLKKTDPDAETFSISSTLDVATSILINRIQGPVPLINAVTRAVIPSLKSQHWVRINNNYEFRLTATEADQWNEVALALMDVSKEPLDGYYSRLQSTTTDLQGIYYTAEEEEEPVGSTKPIERPIAGPKPIERPNKLPSADYVYTLIEEKLYEFTEEHSEGFWDQIEDIYKQSMHIKAQARLYASVIDAEIKRFETKDYKLTLLLSLISAVEEIASSASLSKNTMHDLLAHFISNLKDIPDELKNDLDTELSNKNYYTIVNYLAENNLSPDKMDFCILNLELQRLETINEWLGVIRMLESMLEFSETNLREIWSNSKFQFLIRNNIQNQFVLEKLVELYVSQEDESIPTYIPSDIAKLLRSKYQNTGSSGEDFDWQKIWNGKESLLETLQILYVCQQLPEEFAEVLLANVCQVDSPIQQIMKDAKMLYYWNEDEDYFSEPWDLTTIQKAIDRLLETENVKESLAVDADLTLSLEDQLTIVEENPAAKVKWPNEINVKSYLEIIDPQQEIDPKMGDIKTSLWQLIRQLKLSRMQVDLNLQNLTLFFDENGNNYLSALDRTEILTLLFSITEPPLRNELLYLTSKSARFALPYVIQETRYSTSFLSLHNLILDKITNNRRTSPRIISVLRVGDYHTGKSTFINHNWLKNKSCFVARSSTGSKSKHLNGFVEFTSLSDETADPGFWSMVSSEQKDQIVLVNVHGNALDLPEHLELLKKITSAFIVFWMPQSWPKIQEDQDTLKDFLEPCHSIYNLFVDPGADVMKHIDQGITLRSPFIRSSKPEDRDWRNPEDLNAKHSANVLSLAMTHRAKEVTKITSEVNPEPKKTLQKITLPEKNMKALTLSNFIRANTIGRIKKTLVLQREGWTNPSQLMDFWNANQFYAHIITQTYEILSSPDYPEILSDLSEELVAISENEGRSFRNQLEGAINNFNNDKIKHLQWQHLISRIKNDIQERSLTPMELIVEVCKFNYLCPELLQSMEINFPRIMARFIFESHSIPIPTTKSDFFNDRWMKDALGLLKNRTSRVFVLSCVGSDTNEISLLLNSLFGISFTSARGLPDYEISGLEMRLIHFEANLKEKYGLDGILVIQSRNICRIDKLGDKSHDAMDRRLMTLLLATSNLTLVYNFDNNVAEVLEMSIVSLSKFIQDQNQPVSRLMFVGKDLKIDQGYLEGIDAFSQTSNDYSQTSTLCQKVIKQLFSDIDGNQVIFNLKDFTEIELSRILQTILKLALEERSICPDLFEWCNTLQDKWNQVNNIPFEYNAINKLQGDHYIQTQLNEMFEDVDTAFEYHNEELEFLIHEQIAEINHPLEDNDDSTVSKETLLEILHFEVSSRIQMVFRTCKFNEGNNGKCEFCTKADEKENALLKPMNSAQQIAFRVKVNEYVKFEADNFVKVANQMIFASDFMTEIKDDNAPSRRRVKPKRLSSEFTPMQELSLKRVVIPSYRRMEQEIENIFPNVDFHFDSDSSKSLECPALFESVAAFETEEDELTENNLLDWVHASWLRHKILSIPHKIVLGRTSTMFETGMIRETKNTVEDVLTELETSCGKRIIQPFKMAVMKFVIVKLKELVNQREQLWKTNYDPFVLASQVTRRHLKAFAVGK